MLGSCLLYGGAASAQSLPKRSFGITSPRLHDARWRAASEHQRGLSRTDWLEMGAVALTGAGHLTFSALDASRWFIPIASLSWGGYLAYRTRTQEGFLQDVGLGRRGLRGAFRDASFVALGSTALMAGAGALQGTLDLDPDLLPLFLLYPAWGLVQQVLVQGMVVANLSEAKRRLGSPYVVTPVAAGLFGMVHLPNWKLTAATATLGFAFTPLYLRHGNLWPLGLYHGWLGALFYFWVLDKNPWEDVIENKAEWTVAPTVEGWPQIRLRLSLP